MAVILMGALKSPMGPDSQREPPRG